MLRALQPGEHRTSLEIVRYKMMTFLRSVAQQAHDSRRVKPGTAPDRADALA
jgi:hypothetical protein